MSAGTVGYLTQNGSTCASCGAWIPANSLHTCYAYFGGLANLGHQLQTNALNGIWTELQQIRQLLEKLVAK